MFSTDIGTKVLALNCVRVSHHILIWVTLHYIPYMLYCVHLYMFCSTYWVLGTCVLTRCHVVTDINYVDRGVAARAPLQLWNCFTISNRRIYGLLHVVGCTCIQVNRFSRRNDLRGQQFIRKALKRTSCLSLPSIQRMSSSLKVVLKAICIHE